MQLQVLYPGGIGIWRSFIWMEKNWRTRRKTLEASRETTPNWTHIAPGQIWTQVLLVEGEDSHHSAISSPQDWYHRTTRYSRKPSRGKVKSEPLLAFNTSVHTKSSSVSKCDKRDRAFLRCMFQRHATSLGWCDFDSPNEPISLSADNTPSHTIGLDWLPRMPNADHSSLLERTSSCRIVGKKKIQ